MNIQIGDIVRHEPSGIEGKCIMCRHFELKAGTFEPKSIRIESSESHQTSREWFNASELVLIKKAQT